MTDATVKIDRMLYGGGGGAATDDGNIVVPFTLPGEVVEISIDPEQAKRRTEARLLRVLDVSDSRTEPACIHFGVCGGCQYQHASYPAQLEIKQGILQEMLSRNGINAPDITVHSAEPYGYRNRIQLRVERVEGRWQIGYNERGSHRFMPATMCPITAEPLWALAQVLCDGLNTHRFGEQPVREMELFCNEDASRMEAVILLDVEHATIDRDAPKKFRALCEQVRTQMPSLQGAGLWVWAATPTKSTRGRAQQRLGVEVAAWSEAAIPYRVEHDVFTLERGGFFQVNRFTVPALLHLATDGARGEHAWDLYAGVGLFSSRLLTTFKQVTAVEMGERSYRGLAARLRQAGMQHRALQRDTLQFLREDAKRLPAADFVVVDPPRSGLGDPVARALAERRPREIRYVSCDPTTLTRDLKTLLESGYCLAALSLVDMFPQTFHMESVARLMLA